MNKEKEELKILYCSVWYLITNVGIYVKKKFNFLIKYWSI